MQKESVEKRKYPNPGSHDAYEIGCRCPIIDNNYGRGYLGVPSNFWISENCPLHGKKEASA